MTLHINAKANDIKENIIMTGDPLRAKYISEKYLENARLVNTTRNMLSYTGTYKGKEITIFSHGMGMPSMGIYSYELFNFYNAKNIIRIGTAGANREDIKLLDLVLAESSYSLSNITSLFDDCFENTISSSSVLNNIIENSSKTLDINIHKGKIITTDVFDPYIPNQDKYKSKYDSFDSTLASEMESFMLFYMAKKFKRNATSILTVVDSPFDNNEVSSEQREKTLDNMIFLALESIINVKE